MGKNIKFYESVGKWQNFDGRFLGVSGIELKFDPI